MLKNLRRHLPFVLLFFVFIAFRCAQLHACLHIAHPEEASLGLFIKHILEGSRPVSFFDYFLPYSGGSLITCLLSVPFCKIAGVSILALRWCSILHNAAILVLLYFFARRFWGERVALLTAFFYVLSPPSYSHYTSLFLSGEYFINFLDITVLYLFLRLFFPVRPQGERRQMLLTAALGFFSGLAVYFLFSSILFVSLAAGGWIILRGRFMRAKELFWYAAAFLIGVSPYIYYVSVHSLRYDLLAYFFPEDPVSLAHKIKWFFTFLPAEFARSFHFEFFSYYPGRFFWNYIYAFVMFAAWLYLFWINRGSFKRMFCNLRRRLPGQVFAVQPVIKPEIILLLVPVLFVIFCFFSPYCRPLVFHYRYFFPLYPVFYLLTAISITTLFSGTVKMAKPFALAVVLLLSFISWRGVTGTFGKQDFWDASPLPEVISFMKSEGIGYVYTDYFLKWQILFESEERVIASCDGLPFFYFSEFNGASDCRIYGNSYPVYESVTDKAVRNNAPYAYLFALNPRLPYYEFLENYLCANKIGYSRKLIGGDFVVFYGLSRPLPPQEASLAASMEEYLRQKRAEL
ncbi:MAG: glycosyltransferase family 39 protein [Candidatus Omnitrophota bacterium]|jgi:4-amino-4-deoxy-L-arabinose transferase-like glycosyltransferase